MGYMWCVTITEICEAMELAMARGKKPSESYEEEILFIMKLKGIKPICKTDKTRDELLEDFKQKKMNVLDLSKLIKDLKKKSDNEGKE